MRDGCAALHRYLPGSGRGGGQRGETRGGCVAEWRTPCRSSLQRAGEDAGDGLRVAHPRRRLLLEVRFPLGRHFVVARAATVLRNPPLGRNELAPLEAVQAL